MAYRSNQCFAYKKLKKQIGRQCIIYKRLRETGDLGSMPGMYQCTDDAGRNIPGEDASAFLRGGVITTMACFEAFLHDLLDEAVHNIKYQRDDCDESPSDKHGGGKCLDCQDHLKYKHIFSKKIQSDFDIEKKSAYVGVMLHKWNSIYATTLKDQSSDSSDNTSKKKKKGKKNTSSSTTPKVDLPDTDIIELMQLETFPMNYYYLLDDRWISHIEIKDTSIICLLLRLFYGIRCVMAHGNSAITLEYPGALTHFPICIDCIDKDKKKYNDEERKTKAQCKDLKPKEKKDLIQKAVVDNEHSIETPHEVSSSTCRECFKLPAKLKNIKKLSDIYDECIEERGKHEVLRTARKFPRKKPIEKLSNEDSQRNGIALLNMLFNECEYLHVHVQPTSKFLNENYAFFHLCRIHHWLEEDQREAYVTYNMLVRINQFILLLAHRMRFAVAKHMMKTFKLRKRIWNVPDGEDECREKIRKFEDKHRTRVLRLQEIASTTTQN